MRAGHGLPKSLQRIVHAHFELVMKMADLKQFTLRPQGCGNKVNMHKGCLRLSNVSFAHRSCPFRASDEDA